MAVTKPTLPDGMTSGDLGDLSKQIAVLKLEECHIGAGSYTSADIETKFADKTVLATELTASFEKLGLLAEKPVKLDSKTETAKTLHHKFETKRTTTADITINGISQEKKEFLESVSENGTILTLVCVNEDKSQALILNGMTWSVAWSTEAFGLWTMVLSSEFSGTTKNTVIPMKDIPDAA